MLFFVFAILCYQFSECFVQKNILVKLFNRNEESLLPRDICIDYINIEENEVALKGKFKVSDLEYLYNKINFTSYLLCNDDGCFQSTTLYTFLFSLNYKVCRISDYVIHDVEIIFNFMVRFKMKLLALYYDHKRRNSYSDNLISKNYLSTISMFIRDVGLKMFSDYQYSHHVKRGLYDYHILCSDMWNLFDRDLERSLNYISMMDRYEYKDALGKVYEYKDLDRDMMHTVTVHNDKYVIHVKLVDFTFFCDQIKLMLNGVFLKKRKFYDILTPRKLDDDEFNHGLNTAGINVNADLKIDDYSTDDELRERDFMRSFCHDYHAGNTNLYKEKRELFFSPELHIRTCLHMIDAYGGVSEIGLRNISRKFDRALALKFNVSFSRISPFMFNMNEYKYFFVAEHLPHALINTRSKTPQRYSIWAQEKGYKICGFNENEPVLEPRKSSYLKRYDVFAFRTINLKSSFRMSVMIFNTFSVYDIRNVKPYIDLGLTIGSSDLLKLKGDCLVKLDQAWVLKVKNVIYRDFKLNVLDILSAVFDTEVTGIVRSPFPLNNCKFEKHVPSEVRAFSVTQTEMDYLRKILIAPPLYRDYNYFGLIGTESFHGHMMVLVYVGSFDGRTFKTDQFIALKYFSPRRCSIIDGTLDKLSGLINGYYEVDHDDAWEHIHVERYIDHHNIPTQEDEDPILGSAGEAHRLRELETNHDGLVQRHHGLDEMVKEASVNFTDFVTNFETFAEEYENFTIAVNKSFTDRDTKFKGLVYGTSGLSRELSELIKKFKRLDGGALDEGITVCGLSEAVTNLTDETVNVDAKIKILLEPLERKVNMTKRRLRKLDGGAIHANISVFQVYNRTVNNTNFFCGLNESVYLFNETAKKNHSRLDKRVDQIVITCPVNEDGVNPCSDFKLFMAEARSNYTAVLLEVSGIRVVATNSFNIVSSHVQSVNSRLVEYQKSYSDAISSVVNAIDAFGMDITDNKLVIVNINLGLITIRRNIDKNHIVSHTNKGSIELLEALVNDLTGNIGQANITVMSQYLGSSVKDISTINKKLENVNFTAIDLYITCFNNTINTLSNNVSRLFNDTIDINTKLSNLETKCNQCDSFSPTTPKPPEHTTIPQESSIIPPPTTLATSTASTTQLVPTTPQSQHCCEQNTDMRELTSAISRIITNCRTKAMKWFMIPISGQFEPGQYVFINGEGDIVRKGMDELTVESGHIPTAFLENWTFTVTGRIRKMVYAAIITDRSNAGTQARLQNKTYAYSSTLTVLYGTLQPGHYSPLHGFLYISEKQHVLV